MFRGFGLSDIGLRQDRNQDVVLADDQLCLYGVFDGLGGHTGGETAARIAADVYLDVVAAHTSGSWNTQQLLQMATKAANQMIRESAARNVCLEGMGTTATVILINDSIGTCCHVGDSRAYLVRDGQLRQLTEDHNMVTELAREGILLENASLQKNFTRLLRRALGPSRFVEPELFQIEIRPQDRILLCTDGISKYFNDETDQFLLTVTDIEEIAQFMVNHANACGGLDNASLVVIGGPNQMAIADEFCRQC